MKLDELILLLAIVLQGGGMLGAIKLSEHGSHYFTIVVILFTSYLLLQVLTTVIAKPDKTKDNWFGQLVSATAWLPIISLVYVMLGIWATRKQPTVFGGTLTYLLPITVVALFFLAMLPAGAITNAIQKPK